MRWHLGLHHIGLRPNIFLMPSLLHFQKMISYKLEDLHVGVLGGGDLSAVGKVDVGLLGKRSIDVLVVDVLDHWLKMVRFDYQFIQFLSFCPFFSLTVEFAFLVERSSWLSQILHFRLSGSPLHFIHSNQLSAHPPNVFSGF